MSRLVEVRGPTAQEVTENGAEVVFVRKAGRQTLRVFACSTDDGWSQWGGGQGVLGENVEAVTAWHRGMRAALETA